MRVYSTTVTALIVFFLYSGIFDFVRASGVASSNFSAIYGAIFLISLPLISRRLQVAFYPLLAWLFCYLALVAGGLSRVENPSVSVPYALARLAWVLAVLGCLLIFSYKGNLDIAVTCIVSLSICMSILSCIQFFYPSLLSTQSGRATGLYSNPNSNGIALVLGMSVAASKVPERYRIFYRLLIGAGVLATFSRSSILAWLLVMIIESREVYRGLLRPPYALIASACMVLIAISVFWTPSVIAPLSSRVESYNLTSRIQFFTSGNLDNNSIRVRQEIAKSAFNEFEKSPFLGRGTGSVLADPILNQAGGTHNIYLEGALDYGMLGMLLYFLLPISAVIRTQRRYLETAAAFSLAFLALGWFSQNGIYHSYFLVTLAIAACLVNAPSQKCKNRSDRHKPFRLKRLRGSVQ